MCVFILHNMDVCAEAAEACLTKMSLPILLAIGKPVMSKSAYESPSALSNALSHLHHHQALIQPH